MAEVAIVMDGQEEAQDATAKLTLPEIMASQNLVDKLDKTIVSGLGQAVVRDYQIDEGSRTEWLDQYRKSLDVAMQVKKPKNFPWPKAANINYPLLTVAAVQFQARAYPAIVDGANLVKGKVLGPDPDGQKAQRAQRIADHMSWQLLEDMDGWEEQTDRLLLMLPIVGCVFRKTYYDSITAKNCSDIVTAEDFVVNYWAKSLEAAPRYTHILRLYPYEARERIAAGVWSDVPLSPDGQTNDEDALIEFYEQHRMADLDEDGVPEHYVVITTCDGAVARIAPCFGAENVTVKINGQDEPIKLDDLQTAARQAGVQPQKLDIVRIERRNYFTKYSFMPSPDGSFYDIGFGTLLSDLTGTINTAMNQLLDAGTLANAQGGFLGSGVQIRGGSMRFAIGEWKRVDVVGGSLRDNIVPMATPGPSAVLMNLLQMLIESVKEITSVQDILTGDAPSANQPATTTLAQIEQGQKVMTAIFKRIHRAFGKELRILFGLNRDYGDQKSYFQFQDVPGVVEAQDYADKDLDVCPVSDPSIASNAHKMMMAQALLQFAGNPLINTPEVLKRYFEAIGEPDIDKLIVPPPPPPPDPKALIAAAKASVDKQKADTDALAKHAGAADQLADAAVKLASIGLLTDAATLADSVIELGAMNEPSNGQGPVPAVAGQSPDAGVPPVPAGSPVAPDAGVGLGSAAPTGSAGPSGGAGPDGQPQPQ